jgi:hypothetical protein
MIFDQVHDSNRGLTDMSRDANDLLELDLRRRVEDVVSSQSGKTLSFVPWRAALLCGGTIITATHYTNLNHLGCPEEQQQHMKQRRLEPDDQAVVRAKLLISANNGDSPSALRK